MDKQIRKHFIELKVTGQRFAKTSEVRDKDLQLIDYLKSVVDNNIVTEFEDLGFCYWNISDNYALIKDGYALMCNHQTFYEHIQSENCRYLYWLVCDASQRLTLEKTGYMLDYDAYGRFCVSSVPSNEYFHSVSQVTVSNRLNFVKAKENIDFSFDFEHSLKLLRCYLCSQNAYPDHVDYKNHVFGYEGVDMAFRDIHCLNMVDIRAILEHKNIMCKYFEYITNNGYLKKDTYVLMYKDIALQMKIIFLKIIKKILLYKNNRDYTTECDAIRRLNEKEAKLLEGYLLAL